MSNVVLNSRGRIRPLVREDVSSLKGVIAANGLFPPDMLDQMVAPYLEGTGGEESWLTLDDDGPVALAYFVAERLTQGTWNLLLIAVHPDRQGRGLGTMLQTFVERTLANRGNRILLVETSGLPEFARTRAFYLGLGYEEEGRIRDFYQAGEDKIIFRKSLGSAAVMPAV